MKRRKLLHTLAGTAAAATAAPAAEWSNPFARQWRDSFLKHWRVTRDYTLAVLDAMPADGFDSKPNPAQRTFADQLVHLARANNAYISAFKRGEAPAPPAAADKDPVRKFVAASFDHVTRVLENLTERDLLRTDLTPFPNAPVHSATDLFLRAYMHTAHHRGQAVVYLRVKGITPPAWAFEPTA
jgi:uncharacterized damage-inducible protein DinB